VVRNAAELLREQPPGGREVSPEEWNGAVREIGAMNQLGIVLDGAGDTASFDEDGPFPPLQLRPWIERWLAVDREDLAAIAREIEVNELRQGESTTPPAWRLIAAEGELREHHASQQEAVAHGLAILARVDQEREARQ
jgi:hypothetical protein